MKLVKYVTFFSRRVASEPYDASRVASFITLLTLPISVLREFLKLIAWKKGIAQGQCAETAPSQRPRVELCLESHMGSNADGFVPQDSAGQCLSERQPVLWQRATFIMIVHTMQWILVLL